MAADHARERLARGKVAFSRREKGVPSGFLPLGSARDAEEIITLSVSRQLALMMGYADEPRKKLKGFFPAPGQVGMKARKNLMRYFKKGQGGRELSKEAPLEKLANRYNDISQWWNVNVRADLSCAAPVDRSVESLVFQRLG